MLRLVRTDSYMLNPINTNEHHNFNCPVGEVIMSPRKKYSIISSLNKEINNKIKKKN